MSTSLKIAAAALIALFASCLAANPAHAQHRTNRLSGIIHEVVDVIADELEDYEDEYSDEYDDEDFEEEYDAEDDFSYSDYEDRQVASAHIPASLVGKWQLVRQPGLTGAPKVEYLFRSNGSATRITTGNYYRTRPEFESLGMVSCKRGMLCMYGKRYSVCCRGSQLCLTDARGNVTKLLRVE